MTGASIFIQNTHKLLLSHKTLHYVLHSNKNENNQSHSFDSTFSTLLYFTLLYFRCRIFMNSSKLFSWSRNIERNLEDRALQSQMHATQTMLSKQNPVHALTPCTLCVIVWTTFITFNLGFPPCLFIQ
jgi:hypothetical protein